MRLRLGFVCNSSSSDFIIGDGEGDSNYEDGFRAGVEATKEELIKILTEVIRNTEIP